VKLAIISDIHGNLEALTSTIEEVRRRGIDEIICLGDVIGYGPDPSGCLAILREQQIPCVMGNHDAASFDKDVLSTFSALARIAMEWTITRLNTEEIDFLRTLPYRVERHGLTFVHASPLNPEEFNYLFDIDDASDNFRAFDTHLCFIGHTHQPAVFCEDLIGRKVIRDVRAIVNVGSVGQPRDGNPNAAFGIFDTVTGEFEPVRVASPVEVTAKKIYAAGLPRQLGERLVFGI
jgi:predicted phosphodiesterase